MKDDPSQDLPMSQRGMMEWIDLPYLKLCAGSVEMMRTDGLTFASCNDIDGDRSDGP